MIQIGRTIAARMLRLSIQTKRPLLNDFGPQCYYSLNTGTRPAR